MLLYRNGRKGNKDDREISGNIQIYVECYLNEIHEIERRIKNRAPIISQIQQVPSEKVFMEWVNNSKKPSDLQCLRVDSGKPIQIHR